ncbi:SDR family NAD(P)-dependent oxidoreductase [Leucobacter sp. USHLN153]|uniref:SDR family NAD(P)-dependent oxidoreductase n=1 Tax=Leucobacter sp. USHLN153 TaxID=3081268 RepID=UPI003017D9B7
MANTTTGRLIGLNAIVTGAASGIGRQTALRFAEEGATVLAADLSADGLTKIKSEIEGSGGTCHTHVTDVTDSGTVSALFEYSDEVFDELNCVVNNAGITLTGGVHEISESDWDREMTINVKSIYLMSREAWPRLQKSANASILNTASIAGSWAIMSDAAYCASKAAVVMLTKCMALDGAREGIRVNCVSPGFIDTPMIHGFFRDQSDPAAARAGAIASHPLGRLGHPSDIANGYVYLASGEAEWVTGTDLTVDGGLTSGLWSPGE